MIEGLATTKFASREKDICGYMDDRVDNYFQSPASSTLKNRKNRLTNSIDMKFHNEKSGGGRLKNAWRSKIAVPLVRDAFVTKRAAVNSAFAADPIWTISPDSSTIYESAENMQSLMTCNARNTNYREKCLRSIIDTCCRWGAAATFSYFRTSASQAYRTIPQMVGGKHTGGYDRAYLPRKKAGVYSVSMNIDNYFQDPTVPDPEESSYQGYIEDVRLSDLIADYQSNKDAFVTKNFRKMVEEAKKDAFKDDHYSAPGEKRTDLNWFSVPVRHWWGKLNIKGNEDDYRNYYIQKVGQYIIRIQENPIDNDVVPIDIFTFDKRPEHWWGNVSTETQLPAETYMHFALNMAADSGLQALRKFVFYDKGMDIDMAELNRAAKSGGFVGMEPKNGMDMKKAFNQFQFTDVSTSNLDFILREVKEGAQRGVESVDYSRAPNQGGLQNKTAYASSMLEQKGDQKEAYFLTMFAYGLSGNGRTISTLLQQRAPNKFQIRPDPRNKPKALMKYEILGDYSYQVNTSLTRTKQQQVTNLLNVLTAIQNFSGQPHPSWMNVNISEIQKKWLKQIDEQIDVDDVFPEEQPGMGQQQLPMQPQQAGMQQQQGAPGVA